MKDAPRAADVLGPLLLDLEPRPLPILRILPVPADNVGQGLSKGALRGDRLERPAHDLPDVFGDERQRIERSHIDTAVEPVAVIHEVTDPIGHFRRRVRQTRVHQPREVGLDLKIDRVRFGVVQPMAGLGRGEAVSDVVARHLVREPQRIVAAGEFLGEIHGGGVESLFLQNLDEGQVDVDIVVESRSIRERLEQISVVPDDGHIVLDHRAVVAELRGAAVGDADRLPGPTAANLVAQYLGRNLEARRRSRSGGRGTTPGQAQGNKGDHRSLHGPTCNRAPSLKQEIRVW